MLHQLFLIVQELVFLILQLIVLVFVLYLKMVGKNQYLLLPFVVLLAVIYLGLQRLVRVPLNFLVWL
jgi:hypothetical protein